MVSLASVTDSLVTLATHVIHDLGLPGVFLLMMLDAMAIPFPSEATLLFAGFNVYDGHFTLVGVIVAGVLGDLAGSAVAYSIGYFGRRELLEKHGAKLHLTARRLALTDRWFERYGARAILISRNVPVVRAFSAFPAGAARMPFGRFMLFTLLGVIPWVIAFTVLGNGVGSKWEEWRRHLAFLDYVAVALLVIGIGYLIYRRRRPDAPADASA